MRTFIQKRLLPLLRIDKTNWWKFLFLFVAFTLGHHIAGYISNYGVPFDHVTVLHLILFTILFFVICVIAATWWKNIIPLIILPLSLMMSILWVNSYPAYPIINNLRIVFTDKAQLPRQDKFITWGENNSYNFYAKYSLMRTSETNREKILNLLYGHSHTLSIDPKTESLDIFRISDEFVIVRYTQI